MGRSLKGNASLSRGYQPRDLIQAPVRPYRGGLEAVEKL
jgi:hypothetical protein